MIKRARGLYFISLSIVSLFCGWEALAVNAVPASVEKLTKKAFELSPTEPAEAVECMKDAVCLAELLKVPIEDEIAWLRLTADTTSGSPQISLGYEDPSLKTYCFQEILKKSPLKNADELSIVDRAWMQTHEISESDIARLQEGIATLDARTKEQKRAQAKLLLDLNPERFRTSKYLQRALDLSEQLEPPDLNFEKQVLTKIMSSTWRVVSADDLKLLRRAVERSFQISRTENAYTETAINTLVLNDSDLGSLAKLCEIQSESSRQFLRQSPIYVAPNLIYQGWAYLALDRIDDARRIFEEVKRVTKFSSDCENLYECSLVSLAKTEMKAGRLNEAKSRLLELKNFLDSPTRADACRYGSIGEALMGEISELEGNLEAARLYYEKAETGLMLMERTGSTEYSGIRGIKKLTPDDEFVQSRLAAIYAKLNMPDKQKIAQDNLLKIKHDRKLNAEPDESRKIFAAGYFPKQEVISALKCYIPYLVSTEKYKKNIVARLNIVAVDCFRRGLPDQVEPYMQLAENMAVEPGEKDTIKRNRAWALSMQGDYVTANQMLNEITASDTSSDDEKEVANWLYSRNLMAQGFPQQSANVLAGVLKYWKPNGYSLPLYMQACCDQAQYLIKQNKYSEAETCLKAYLSLPTTKFDSDSSLWEEHGNINYPIALLAKVQALRKKTEESKVNYATACKPERNRPKYGIMAAMIDKTLADAALELHYEARALRLYLDASEKFNEMGAFRKEAEDCKDQANKLVPTGA